MKKLKTWIWIIIIILLVLGAIAIIYMVTKGVSQPKPVGFGEVISQGLRINL